MSTGTTVRRLEGIGVNWQMRRDNAMGSSQAGDTFSSDGFRMGEHCTRGYAVMVQFGEGEVRNRKRLPAGTAS